MISVIIPTYNRSHLILNAVESVLTQTIKNVEIIVVDDGSTDNTKDVLINKFGDAIRYEYKENGGSSSGRNYGIKLAKGEYIAFLDDDDIWLPEKLELQLKILESNPETGLVYCGAIIEDENAKLLRTLHCKEKGYILKQLLVKNCIGGGTSSVLIKKECFSKVGLFDENLKYAEDYDMWLRLACEYKIDFVDSQLVKLRVHTDNKSINIQEVQSCALKIIERIFILGNLPKEIQRQKNYFYGCKFANFIEDYYYRGDMKNARISFLQALRLHPLAIKNKHCFVFLKSFIKMLSRYHEFKYVKKIQL